MIDGRKSLSEQRENDMSIEEVKEYLVHLKENPEKINESNDDLDDVIRELIRIERKHLYQVEKTSVQRRRRDIRQMIESKVPKALGLDDDS